MPMTSIITAIAYHDPAASMRDAKVSKYVLFVLWDATGLNELYSTTNIVRSFYHLNFIKYVCEMVKLLWWFFVIHVDW